MLTRKEPYAGRNFMGVTLDVLEEKRPQVCAIILIYIYITTTKI